ncbi:MAG: Hsp20/alpha crystallin family protein, partial [Bacteroidota bacterium]
MRHHLIPSPVARNWFHQPAYRRRYAGTTQERPFRPAANILETEDSFEITLVVPGRTKEDFKVELEKQILTIRAEQSEDQRTYKRQEFVLKGFERRFELSDAIDK